MILRGADKLPFFKVSSHWARRTCLAGGTRPRYGRGGVEAFMLRVAGIESLNCPCCCEGRFRVLQGISPLGVKKAVHRLPRAPPQKPS